MNNTLRQPNVFTLSDPSLTVCVERVNNWKSEIMVSRRGAEDNVVVDLFLGYFLEDYYLDLPHIGGKLKINNYDVREMIKQNVTEYMGDRSTIREMNAIFHTPIMFQSMCYMFKLELTEYLNEENIHGEELLRQMAQNIIVMEQVFDMEIPDREIKYAFIKYAQTLL